MTFLRAVTLLALIWLAFDPGPAVSFAVYVLIGVQVIGWLWPRLAGRYIVWQRHAPLVLAPDEVGEVTITISYQGRLPLPYLIVTEDVPPSLSAVTRKRWVLSLRPGQRYTLRYQVQGRQRGLYWLGPLRLVIGTVIDRNEVLIGEHQPTPLTIVPHVVPLPLLELPAGLPYSQERRRLSLFDDPAQTIGVRHYRPGDSPRLIDWKTSARLGELHVRELAPVIARMTVIALEFSETAYRGRFARDDRERAVIATASLATTLINRQQAVGLCSNGYDPLTKAPIVPLLPRAEHDHLRTLLLLLGRIEPVSTGSVLTELSSGTLNLSWGSTLITVTAALDEAWLAGLTMLRRRGLYVAVILADPGPSDVLQARRYGIAAYRLDRAGGIVVDA
ncbi:DUF58 domain-containing protein [Chloroflexus aggregans]|uniref:DUF58 domain-containing protein n=1 Tax=Chloroflexus aggregans (strain MD-66 / DSM 9485) TaxID=326427 RepID=B8G4K5_CHLAD|nr:DUF58 domain-containing protein [Chloroflexus aggregans]ACL25481.1 protein of unknown function DUF58 [Chloroflexus aggregans DSM 9485]